ncbi:MULTISPECIES: LPS export ABC transporter permease LptG [Marichromatium]|uniref:Lipopolysaccharide export system permease protein n=2 Tax=Marichromatium TaxID=85076 RepID=A0A4R4AID6_MARGR|nr:LPS export ABC transporter permease LptG [Marichromatium gracile]MBK1708332.1 LPS export ABC transporter permease LptG [Marichromatium gracile]MBO8087276.1 LPS export ABC transporter permease LptG [Marichromatium sp.]TCW38539.1 lipopolysaccharide export system permease protein [Marichromatium gracile]
MRIIDRYLGGAVVVGTLVTLGVLLPLLGFFVLADEMEAAGVDGFGFGGAMTFMLLSLPGYAYQLFPIATLIGALVGLGTLASRSELVALRAAGVSVAQIVRAAMLGGVLLALLAVVLGEVLAPLAEQRGAELRREALSGEVAQQTADGFWAVDDGAYVNIREIRSGTSLSDISIFQVDAAAGTLVSTHADGARYVDDGWVLQGIARSRVRPDGVEVERIAQARWDSMLDPGLLKVVVAEPQALPVWGLYKYIRFMRVNGQDAGAYEVAFWGKVLHPVLTLSMIFVAIPILLGSARSSGMGRRIFAGVLIGILYYLISRTLAYLALLFGLSPLLAALAPPLLFSAGAMVLLRRVG